MMADTDSTQTARNMRRRTTKLERAGDYWSQQEVDQLRCSSAKASGSREWRSTSSRRSLPSSSRSRSWIFASGRTSPIAGERPATIAAYHAAPVRLPRAPVPTVNATASSRSTNKC